MIKSIISEIQQEIASEKDTMLKKLIEEQLKTFVFDEKNLSPTLISRIMATTSGSTKIVSLPTIDKDPIPDSSPVDAEKISDASDFIDVNIPAIINDLQVGNNVYLYGKAGTGKSTLATKIANEFLNKELYEINCNQFTSPVEIRGGQTIDGYKDGNLVLAWENGGLLLLDELPKLDPNTAGLLNQALAKSGDKEKWKEVKGGKSEYMRLKEKLEQSDRYLGYELKEEAGRYLKKTHITITDGKGDLRRRGDGFMVIGTGNTNMKSTSTNYSGNNRQDYSLVDRFAGSFYEVNYNEGLENQLIYALPLACGRTIREFLDKDTSRVESVSIRTMLNFNRIYEQEMLRKIDSPYALKVMEIEETDDTGRIIGLTQGKTFAQSIESFIDTLTDTVRTQLLSETNIEDLYKDETDPQVFMQEFMQKKGFSPLG